VSEVVFPACLDFVAIWVRHMRSTRSPSVTLHFRRPISRRAPTDSPNRFATMLTTIGRELHAHAPFTVVGALSGIAIMVIGAVVTVPRAVSVTLFWSLHPLHVLLSAMVTAGMYRLHSRGRFWPTIAIGYCGSIGIATLSDCMIPYIGEWLLDLPNRGIHFGFIEHWWLLNSMAGTGVLVAYRWPATRFPHAGHVLLSTWASLFHMTMALGGDQLSLFTAVVIFIFLFLAVWVPCCTSDIVFPLLFARRPSDEG
jgi:hypothetical protein